jgi:hypothetical protein
VTVDPGTPEGILLVRGTPTSCCRACARGCVDAVVTDPPWNLGRPYGAHDDRMAEEDYVRWLNRVLREYARVGRAPVAACIGTHNAGRTGRLLAGTGLAVAARLDWHREPGRPEAVVIAARAAGRRSVGFELEERFCRTAAARLRLPGARR